ncbi:MAG: alpha-galactosidase [Armatimonadota bacterium]
MNVHITICCILGLSLIMGSQPVFASEPIDSLPGYMAESGIPTHKEIDFTKKWASEATRHSKNGWVDGWVSAGLPFTFKYGGRESDDLLKGWKSTSSVKGNVREVIWQDPDTGLKVIWQVKQFADYPAVDWVLSFENTGSSDTLLIEDFQALRISLNHSKNGQPYTVHGAYGGRSLPDDLMPFSTSLPTGDKCELRLGTTGENPDPWFYAFHSSNNHLPFFNIETPDNRGVMVGIGWSGQWLAKMSTSGNQLTAHAGLKETRFILHSGERVRSPKILLLFWNGERLHGHNMLRQILHKHYVPSLDGKPQQPLVSVNTCFTYHGNGGFLYTGDKELLPLVDPFAEIGAESFVVDAGWWECNNNFNINIGTYQPSPERYPNGLRTLSDRLSQKGIKYLGLWMPVETVDPNTPFAQQNPGLVADNRWELGPWRLRMEVPEAREWILSQIDSLVKDQGMSCYRQDFYTAYYSESDDRKGVMEMQHLDGLYKIQDEMRKRHPDMLMEGCSGGGRRIDLETISRFHWHQKSDRWFDSVSDQCGLYGANMFLPGGTINVPVNATSDYGMWSAFGGQVCLGWHLLDPDFPMAQAKQQVERYKMIRPFLSGDFYPLTPCSPDSEWLAYQFHRSDMNSGFALIFRRNGDGDIERFRLALKGLNPESDYMLHLEHLNKDITIMGTDISNKIDIPVTDLPGVEMIIYKAQETGVR